MDAKKLGAQIRMVRIDQGLTQAELAEQVGLALKYYSNLEAGHKNMSFDTFIRIANTLHIDANTLLIGNLENTGECPASFLGMKLKRLPERNRSLLIRIFEKAADEMAAECE